MSCPVIGYEVDIGNCDGFDVYRFCFNDTATTEIYTLSLHDALPISPARSRARWSATRGRACASSTSGSTSTSRTRPTRDRKSTRLNSSHANISYAVFCLKKKKKKQKETPALKKKKKNT